jgi:hypothetical protein
MIGGNDRPPVWFVLLSIGMTVFGCSSLGVVFGLLWGVANGPLWTVILLFAGMFCGSLGIAFTYLATR